MSEQDKYRAWNISGQQWEYFTLKELACGGVYTHPYDMPAICQWANYKWWCRWTGLKDKNEQEVYAGDKVMHPRYHEGYLVVQWDTFGWALFWQMCNEMWLDEDVTVIGNIHTEEKPCKNAG